MNHSNILSMRIDGLNAADLTQMLDRNHARAKLQRRRKRMVRRARIVRVLTTAIVIGGLMALAAW